MLHDLHMTCDINYDSYAASIQLIEHDWINLKYLEHVEVQSLKAWFCPRPRCQPTSSPASSISTKAPSLWKQVAILSELLRWCLKSSLVSRPSLFSLILENSSATSEIHFFLSRLASWCLGIRRRKARTSFDDVTATKCANGRQLYCSSQGSYFQGLQLWGLLHCRRKFP